MVHYAELEISDASFRENAETLLDVMYFTPITMQSM